MKSGTFEKKEEKISIRLDYATKQKIERAAKLDNRSITSFIIASAMVAADKILSRADQTQPPAPSTSLKAALQAYKKMKIPSDV